MCARQLQRFCIVLFVNLFISFIVVMVISRQTYCAQLTDVQPPESPQDPCEPSPCGANAHCWHGERGITCFCLPEYYGDPYTGCRPPACVTNSDCDPSKACFNNKCEDPCIDASCGLNAKCEVINHDPWCRCFPEYIGDPIDECHPKEQHGGSPMNLCIPSPCGPYSECRQVNDHAVCSCQKNYVGSPPACRPECMDSSECPQDEACKSRSCVDPCPGTCSPDARCQVINHNPICSCPPDYTGDPFVRCIKLPILTETSGPCHPSPCGSNAVCEELDGAGSCQCLPEYSGDPYTSCRPECVLNSECPHDKACVNNKCINPCIGVCGANAECRVINHAPSCSCVIGYTGNPLVSCHPTPKPPPPRPERPRNPCIPSPCGPYSECRQVDNHAVCSCQKNYIGSPPACRPECVVSSECAQNKACIKQKCQDPCIGTCGYNARCQVVSHNPICSCSPGFTGDPFVRCVKEEPVQPEELHPTNPCIPSPCGPNSQCRVIGSNPACSCLKNYVGRPPNCRPECTINEECPPHLACQNERCRDPCIGSCGAHSTCATVKHVPHCNCKIGYTGDPFTGCTLIVEVRPPESSQDPCGPSPCGANAVCKQGNGADSCLCLPGYYGDPYTGCRPECVTNSDCDCCKACFNNKCEDPCIGASCGLNAKCEVINHDPSCTCLPEYIGDPIIECHPKEEHRPRPTDPCIPSPCGQYSECRPLNDHALCSCQKNYVGSPPACRPECMVSSECPQDEACIRQSCVDPCLGTCSPDARCQVINHNPICSCPPDYTGDPSVRCIKLLPIECEADSDCNDLERCDEGSCIEVCSIYLCGQNAICNANNHTSVCSCPSHYIGDPQEQCTSVACESDDQCSNDKICYNGDCVNPCWINNPCAITAKCYGDNHRTACKCLPDLKGDPFVKCELELECHIDAPCTSGTHCSVLDSSPVATLRCTCPERWTRDGGECIRIPDPIIKSAPPPPPPPPNPCVPSPCGANAVCQERNYGVGSCICLPEYYGDPYTGCRPECVTNSDCDPNRACLNNKCKDPCPGTCGLFAECRVMNHAPSCSCLPSYTGDPISACHQIQEIKPENVTPCTPSPCGPYSKCIEENGRAVCSCQQNYIGTSSGCRPECMVDSDCAQNKQCINPKCVDPCPGRCGKNAKCHGRNHHPFCECLKGYIGKPLVRCVLEVNKLQFELG
ncbi:neurogenic locus notch homolog protein 2-like [Planococcus citri]|uniref:neurogenic locus notch homolog protein 2-like n=1 Tax=Planococcus citri TaxID=170843 RepID=UPI0031F85E6E